ncbi:MAG: formyltetrahydrofolate deformylase [Polyangiaceae bacterium]|jgi:formyltetrahydrofolate deformylase
MIATSSSKATFLITASDQPGLVARLAGFFAELGLNIVDASNHSSVELSGTPRFYMRIEVDLDGLTRPAAHARLGESVSRRSLEEAFGRLAHELGATWSVRYADSIAKVALLVTREATCLYDLLLRQQSGELPCEIPLIVSNHSTLERVAESFRIPFFVLPITADTKRAQEERLLELLRRHHIDLVVLARYMQVLTDSLIGSAPPVINIHHGFLPAFQGAKPYHQAYARGVKIIGATAHYATAELDQGPIIEQDVARVDHRMGPDEMARVGRDVERVVLARAVLAHLEHRVIVDGPRTIIL